MTTGEVIALIKAFGGSGGGSSGGGVLVVVSEYDEQKNNSFLNMTAQELYDELQGGAIVVCKEVNANGGAWYYPLCEYTKIGNLFNFYFISGNANDYSASTIQFQSTNANVRPNMM